MPMNHVNGIRAHCPRCYCEPEKIDFWNGGAIIWLQCPMCGFVIDGTESEEDNDYTLQSLVEIWNKAGVCT